MDRVLFINNSATVPLVGRVLRGRLISRGTVKMEVVHGRGNRGKACSRACTAYLNNVTKGVVPPPPPPRPVTTLLYNRGILRLGVNRGGFKESTSVSFAFSSTSVDQRRFAVRMAHTSSKGLACGLASYDHAGTAIIGGLRTLSIECTPVSQIDVPLRSNFAVHTKEAGFRLGG